jgi:oligopeptide/dipeptide ABC transporter ATP-binding protein
MTDPLLEFRSASKRYAEGRSRAARNAPTAIDNVDLIIDGNPPLITALAGESGSGKTTLANAALGFVRLTSGQVLFQGRDVSKLRGKEWFRYRQQVQAVFQDPYETFNPFYRVQHVFDQITKRFDLGRSRSESRRLVEQALLQVGLEPNEVLDTHPHQLSGGQRQRIMIARLVLLRPRLVIADEPVSMVDASLRMSILEMMVTMRDKQGISFLYITHDLSTAYRISDEIYILYGGRIAEAGATKDVIDRPKHPYVQLLIDSVPGPEPDPAWRTTIAGDVEVQPSVENAQSCLFYPRCPHGMDRCTKAPPPLFTVATGHRTACFLYDSPNGTRGERP